jgi:hypothetical protein
MKRTSAETLRELLITDFKKTNGLVGRAWIKPENSAGYNLQNKKFGF